MSYVRKKVLVDEEGGKRSPGFAERDGDGVGVKPAMVLTYLIHALLRLPIRAAPFSSVLL